MLKTIHQQKTQLSIKTEHLLKKLLAMKWVVKTLVIVQIQKMIQLLPSEYEYKICICRRVDTSGNFEAEFKVNMYTDREVKEWVKEYNKDIGLWLEKVTKGEACYADLT